MPCCEECAYPGNPGVCVRGGSCPCHDTEDDEAGAPALAALDARFPNGLDLLAAIAARYDGQDNEAARLEAGARRRLEYRRRHSGKSCDRCRETKALSAFSRDSREKDGLRRYCRACDALGARNRVNKPSA